MLTREPGMGTRDSGQARKLPLSKFPYTLVYRVHDDLIEVIALSHQNRKPGYWQGR